MAWYVLRARNEYDVRGELAERGFYGYVPTERVSRRLGRKVRPTERPVWRGYVFVLCQAEDVDPIIRMMGGGYDFVRWPQEIDTPAGPIIALRPIVLGLGLLDPILYAEAVGELDYASRETHAAQLGDRVLVRSGKWKGFLGRVVALSKHKLTLEGEKGTLGRLQIEPEHLSQAPEEQHLAA